MLNDHKKFAGKSKLILKIWSLFTSSWCYSKWLYFS